MLSLLVVKQRGFTIVELLIVVVVIAILATVVIVAYNGLTSRAQDAVASGDITSVGKQLETIKIQNSETYPSGTTGVAVSAGSDFQYTQLNGGANYCATVARGSIAYLKESTSPILKGICPDHLTTASVSNPLRDLDWSAAQIPTVLNGSVSTTLAGEAVTISSVTSVGSITGTHIDGNTDASTYGSYYCYPVNELEGISCPSLPTPDMQLTTGRTLTITLEVPTNAYSSLSFLMSDVENNSTIVQAYDANNVLLSSALWRVMSYDISTYDAVKGYYTSVSPANTPNPFTNSGTGISFSAIAGQNQDCMRVAFDLATLSRLKKVVVSFTSAATTDWLQWNFLARHL